MYDGIPFVSANQSGDYRIQPVPVEALQEFSLVQNNFSAEYSRTPGGNLTYSTRSGGSSFHGQAYEYARNTDLDAAGYYATSATITHQNEFGVNIGGPVNIPFLGLKKDKMYFFAFYSGYRLAAGVTPSDTRIPSLAERTGDFSADTIPSTIRTRPPAMIQASAPVRSTVQGHFERDASQRHLCDWDGVR